MELTPAQLLMVRDGLPIQFLLWQQQQAAWWRTNPPRAMPLFQTKPKNEDAATTEFRAKVEAERKQKSLRAIAKMKLRMSSKAIDHSKMRWDARRGKFVEDLMVGRNERAKSRNHEPCCQNLRTPTDRSDHPARTQGTSDREAPSGLECINEMNVKYMAELNNIWKLEYEKLKGGLLIMTVRNRLRGVIKRGGEIKWTK